MDKPKDKKYLEVLCKCLSISKRKIRKDECGDYIFPCKEGKIFTVGAYWYIYFNPENPKRWNNFKKKLDWMYPNQDGDWEGIVRADFPPSPEQAAMVRKAMKIRISTPPEKTHGVGAVKAVNITHTEAL